MLRVGGGTCWIGILRLSLLLLLGLFLLAAASLAIDERHESKTLLVSSD